ncbi:hypothetical protein RIF29_18346 [Crotalaria pallida]|uniref:Uncharacterized protein n=1 Tax=Crotalaria pallida TaxID=3830 RepID=A0AAN9IHA2_CROPI
MCNKTLIYDTIWVVNVRLFHLPFIWTENKAKMLCCLVKEYWIFIPAEFIIKLDNAKEALVSSLSYLWCKLSSSSLPPKLDQRLSYVLHLINSFVGRLLLVHKIGQPANEPSHPKLSAYDLNYRPYDLPTGVGLGQTDSEYLMAIRLPNVLSAKHILRRSSLFATQAAASTTSLDMPKGYFAVYVGEGEKKRFVVPLSLLNLPSFQELLSIAEEEFGFTHSMGGLTIPCTEDMFINITSGLLHKYLMAIRLPNVLSAKHILRRSSLFATQAASITSLDMPKGYFAVYVGEGEKKRFVVPLSLLNLPSFQELLSIAEEEFGFTHPMGGLTIPCTEDMFINITSGLHS